MTVFRTGVEFGTNVGVLERDYQRAQAASTTWGAKAAQDLRTVTVAQDQLSLASQRVAVADAKLIASRERLNGVLANSASTQREIAAAQGAFVAAQDRLIAAQAKQTEIIRTQQAEQIGAGPGRPGHFGAAGVLAGFAATALAIRVKDAVENGARAAAGLQAIDRQIESTLTSTGNAAGTSIEHIDAESEAISKLTGISEEATRGGQLLELTFTGIRNEGSGAAAIFDRTAQAAAAMTIGLHLARGTAIDYQGSMQLLARALNDPVRGLDTLRRSGVQFTAQQREQIKALADQGQLLQAQELILGLVNQKFSKATTNYASTSAGAYAQVREAVQELDRALAAPALSTGVPILHALRDTAEFFASHPASVWAGEIGVGLTGLAFTVAAVERAFKFLGESRTVGAIVRVLSPFRSVERQAALTAAAEDARAVAAGRAAEASNANALAMDREAASARRLAGALGTADVAETGAGGGLLRRLMARAGIGAGAAAGEGGLGVAAGAGVGLVAAAAAGGIALGARNLSRSGRAEDLIQQLLDAQAHTRGGYGDPRFAAAISGLQSSSGPFGLFGTPGSAFSRAEALLASVRTAYAGYANTVRDANSDFETAGKLHQLLISQYTAERDAIYQTDLADANAAQHRADRAERAYRQARVFEAQVRAGNAAAIKDIETQIGVAAPSLFDLVNPHAGREASAVASVQSAQASSSSAERRVALAEQRLAALRANSKATAYELQSAEDSLANARDHAAVSSTRLSAAEQKARDVRSSALSVADVLKRAASQVSFDQGQAAASRRLVQMGITEPVLQQLLALDQQAPGTFARIASHITAAGVRQLDRDQRLKDAARHALEEAFAHADTKSTHDAAARSADLAAQAWQQAYLAAIRDPKFWDLVNTSLGQLLIANTGVLPAGSTGAGGSGTTGGAPTVGGLLKSGLPHRDMGGPIPGRRGEPRLIVAHGGEYVLSTDMIEGRKPIGVALGMAAGGTAPNVVVHVHTAAPSYQVHHSVNVGEVRAHDYHDFRRQMDAEARVRAVAP